jgi:iron(III) transport system permease protein
MSGEVSSAPGIARRRRRRLPTSPLGIAAVLLVAFLIGYPVVRLLILAIAPDGKVDVGVFHVFAQPWFPGMARDTIVMVLVSAALAVVIGSVLAWINERTDASLGLAGDVLPLVPLLVPSIGMAIGWIFLASPNSGFLNGPLRMLFPSGFQFNIFTWPGLVFVVTLNLVPYVYLIMSSALRNLDSSLEEASAISGAGLGRTLLRVSLPATRQALAGSALLTVIVGLALYSVPSVIGTTARIDIFSVRIIRLVKETFPADIGGAAVLGMFLFAVIAIVFVVYQRVTTSGNFATISGKTFRTALVSLGGWRWVARGGIVLYVLLASVLPVLALLVVAFQPFWTPNIDVTKFSLVNFNALFQVPALTSALRNSIMLAFVVGGLAVILAVGLTVFSRHLPRRLRGLVRGLTKVPSAVSAVVIGLSFLVAFAGPPFNLSGTFVILGLAYIVLFLPELTISIESASSQIGGDLEEAAQVSGAGRWRVSMTIVWRLMLPAAMRAWSLIFVLIIGELATATLLSGVGTPVVGAVILQIWDSGGFGQLGALAATMTGATTLAVIIFSLVARLLRRHW